jgi:hypothetical protein
VRLEHDFAPGRYQLSLVLQDPVRADVSGSLRLRPDAFSIAITDLSPVRAQLDASFLPNPKVFEKIRAGEPTRATDIPGNCGHHPTSAAPALLLETAGKYAELRLSVPPNEAYGLIVTDGQDRTACGSSVVLKDLVPGTLRIRPMRGRGELFSVRIEDPARSGTGEVVLHVELQKRIQRFGIKDADGAKERQEAFLGGPAELFVYPVRDLESRSARYQGWRGDEGVLLLNGKPMKPSAATGETEPIRYPRRDEPLLATRVMGQRIGVVTADGSSFFVGSGVLSLRPDGPLQLPATVANVFLTWTDAQQTAEGADKKKLDALLAADQKSRECAERFWDKYHGGTNRKLLRVTYQGGRVTRVENYTALMEKKLAKVCRFTEIGKRLEKLHMRLRQSEIRRRAERLERIRAKLASAK